ncbi:MAG: methyl-accepting chemotaxis protein [Angelakisella sp.]
MKTIKSKIMSAIILVVVVSLVTLGSVSLWLTNNATGDALSRTMTQTAKITGERVSQELQLYKNIAMEAGMMPEIADSNIPTAYKSAVIKRKSEEYGLSRGNILGVDGVSMFDGKNYSDREYFVEAMKGNSFVSDPLISKTTGELSIIVAAPIWKNGILNSQVIGVVYFVPKETFLTDIVTSIQISSGGSAYILNKMGVIVAHKEVERVKNNENIFELAKTDTSLEQLAAHHQKMIAGEIGFDTYSIGGVKKFLAFAPISSSNGWSIGINAPTKDFAQQVTLSFYVIIAMVIIFIILASLVAAVISGKISRPIKQCAQRLDLLAQGDFTSPVPTTKSKDETGRLLQDLDRTVQSLHTITKDVSMHLKRIAGGNLATELTMDYHGDFAKLRVSMESILTGLNVTLSQINVSAEQVSSGSGQVSDGAQALSQGATEQASAIQELSATIGLISDKVQANAKNAQNAKNTADKTGQELTRSNAKMNEMITAMGDISNKSGQIGKIIKTIEDIAFQTNILALNAAVEAARAGAAGKGFAVVADEVRNLASKSAEAAKNTTALIGETVKAVGNGTRIADDTAKSILAVVDEAKLVISLVDEIAAASEEQASSIGELTNGIEQIASVVQTNSATAEESAAASEELSSQAQMLQELVGQFTLQDELKSY